MILTHQAQENKLLGQYFRMYKINYTLTLPSHSLIEIKHQIQHKHQGIEKAINIKLDKPNNQGISKRKVTQI